jgi:hypothetical protein
MKLVSDNGKPPRLGSRAFRRLASWRGWRVGRNKPPVVWALIGFALATMALPWVVKRQEVWTADEPARRYLLETAQTPIHALANNLIHFPPVNSYEARQYVASMQAARDKIISEDERARMTQVVLSLQNIQSMLEAAEHSEKRRARSEDDAARLVYAGGLAAQASGPSPSAVASVEARAHAEAAIRARDRARQMIKSIVRDFKPYDTVAYVPPPPAVWRNPSVTHSLPESTPRAASSPSSAPISKPTAASQPP